MMIIWKIIITITALKNELPYPLHLDLLRMTLEEQIEHRGVLLPL